MTQEPEITNLGPVDITNEFALHTGVNMPNHSTTMQGRGKYVKPGTPVTIFRTRQSAFRFAAYLLCLAEILPNEDDPATFEEVLDAVRNV